MPDTLSCPNGCHDKMNYYAFYEFIVKQKQGIADGTLGSYVVECPLCNESLLIEIGTKPDYTCKLIPEEKDGETENRDS